MTERLILMLYAADLARFVILYFESKGDPITNKKLQKLLYYIQAWNLVYFGDSLFPEQPQAWIHGPAYPDVYRQYKESGYSPLSVISQFESTTERNSEEVVSEQEKKLGIPPERLQLIKEVLGKYGNLSSFQLETLSHREAPWLNQRSGLGEFENSDRTIPFEAMKEYYRSLLTKTAHHSS